MLVNKNVIVTYILNGNDIIQTETGYIQVQEMGEVVSVENVDFYVNVFVKSSQIKVKLGWIAEMVNAHINKLCKRHFNTFTRTYIRNYTIFSDDGVKEVVTKRTIRYKS
jgi:hypothetical protein